MTAKRQDQELVRMALDVGATPAMDSGMYQGRTMFTAEELAKFASLIRAQVAEDCMLTYSSMHIVDANISITAKYLEAK